MRARGGNGEEKKQYQEQEDKQKQQDKKQQKKEELKEEKEQDKVTRKEAGRGEGGRAINQKNPHKHVTMPVQHLMQCLNWMSWLGLFWLWVHQFHRTS